MIYKLNINLETERLSIKPLTVDDKELFCSLYTSPRVMKYISEPLSIESAEKLFRKSLKFKLNERKSAFWRITSQSGLDIGVFGLYKNNESNMSWDLGTLIKPQFQSLGYASEAMRALIKYLLELNIVEEITGTIPHGNIPCENLVKSLGYSRSFECKNYSHWKVTEVL